MDLNSKPCGRPTPGSNALQPIGPRRLPGLRGPALALALLLGLNSCALYPDFLKRPPVRLRWVTILADERMNDDFPVALDLVVAYDEDLITRLEAMPAADWYASKLQIERDFRSSVWLSEWEVVPGSALICRRIRLPKRAPAAFFFARYLAPGEHRIPVGKEKSVTLELNAETLAIKEREEPRECPPTRI